MKLLFRYQTEDNPSFQQKAVKITQLSFFTKFPYYIIFIRILSKENNLNRICSSVAYDVDMDWQLMQSNGNLHT